MWPAQEMWPRLARNRSPDSHTSLDLSVCEAWQVVPVARQCKLTRLLMSDQKYVYLFNQTATVSVFKSSKGSNNGPGGTGNERSLWAYLNTLFIIMNCVFDPQFNNHDWTCLWFYMFMRGKKLWLTACRCCWRIHFKTLIRKASFWTFSDLLVALFPHI